MTTLLALRPSAAPSRRRLLLAPLLAGALLLGACGDDDNAAEEDSAATTDDAAADTTAPAATDDGSDDGDGGGGACDIVSDEVVAEVLGIEVERREENGTQGAVGCIKGSERAADISQSSFVSVSVLTGGSMMVAQFESESGAEPVEGFGDDAVFVPSTGSLTIADGSDAVLIQVYKTGQVGSQEDAVTVAEDVFERRD